VSLYTYIEELMFKRHFCPTLENVLGPQNYKTLNDIIMVMNNGMEKTKPKGYNYYDANNGWF